MARMELKAVHISKIYRQLKPKRFDALKNVGIVKDNSKGKKHFMYVDCGTSTSIVINKVGKLTTLYNLYRKTFQRL